MAKSERSSPQYLAAEVVAHRTEVNESLVISAWLVTAVAD